MSQVTFQNVSSDIFFLTCDNKTYPLEKLKKFTNYRLLKSDRLVRMVM